MDFVRARELKSELRTGTTNGKYRESLRCVLRLKDVRGLSVDEVGAVGKQSEGMYISKD